MRIWVGFEGLMNILAGFQEVVRMLVRDKYPYGPFFSGVPPAAVGTCSFFGGRGERRVLGPRGFRLYSSGPSGKSASRSQTERRRVSGGTDLQPSQGCSRATFPVLSRDPILFRKPSKIQGNSRLLKRTMVEKNGESTPRAVL